MELLVFLIKSSILLVRMKTKYLQLLMMRSQKNHMHTIQTINNMNTTHSMTHQSIFCTFHLNHLCITPHLVMPLITTQ